MMVELLQTEIKGMIDSRQWGQLRSTLSIWSVPDLADLMLELADPERVVVFRLLPRDLASDVFAELELPQQNELLADLTDEETRRLLHDLAPDDRTELLEELPGRVTQKLLNLLSGEDLQEARALLGYPEGSVGRLMTPDYVAVRSHWTITQALNHIREMGQDSETLSTIYVVDANWKLLDSLELQRFILTDPSHTVAQIMDGVYESVVASDDQEEAVRVMQRHDLFALPVVDTGGILLGIVTIDDVLDVAQEEATADFQKVAAVAPLRISYRESGVSSLYRKRVGWLMTLVLVSLASSGVIAAYEEVLNSAIALAFFIPLLIASGGNAGAQSATLMIRALATGDVEINQWLLIIFKELAVGITLGITMGFAASFLGLARGGMSIALVVGLTMASIVLVANIIGVTLPFLLTKMKLDPAVASSPLITTLADATGLLIYFAIATRILGL